MFMVRGIGVAVRVSTSTLVRIFFRRSLWVTPKRCSSSTITSPRSLNRTFLASRAWVPITMSRSPRAALARISSRSLAVRNRESMSTRTGNSRKRSRKVFQCCSARMVVGTSIATCLPPSIALNAARTATSVLPNPTSPQMRRSMGTGASMSCLTSSTARSWSGVSSKGNDPSSSRCHGLSEPKACPGCDRRSA
jgi:hypothetical protein